MPNSLYAAVTAPIQMPIITPVIRYAGIIGLMLSIGSVVHATGDLWWPIAGVLAGTLCLVDLIDGLRNWAKDQGASAAAAQIVVAIATLLFSTMVSMPGLFG